MLLPAVIDMGPTCADMLAFSNSMLPNVALLVAMMLAVLRVVPFTCSVLVGESVLIPILLPL
jgi:hypothetical protein